MSFQPARLWELMAIEGVRRRLTFRQIADEIGISHSTTTRLKQGKDVYGSALHAILLWLEKQGCSIQRSVRWSDSNWTEESL